MDKKLRAYLEDIGLRSDADAAAAWDFYEQLTGERREIAQAIKEGRLEGAPGQRNEPPAGGHRTAPPAPGPTPPANTPPEPPNDGGQRTQAPPAPGTTPGQAPGDPTLDAARREAAELERRRIAEIREIAGQDWPEENVRRAIDEAWSTDQVRQAVLEHMRRSSSEPVEGDADLGLGGQAPAGHVHGREAASAQRDALAAALCLRTGFDLNDENRSSLRDPGSPRPWDGRRAEQAFDRAWAFRDLPIPELCRRALQLEGRSVPTGWQEMIRSGVSTATFKNIFSTSVNARLLRGFERAPDTSDWVRTADVADFKTQDRILVGKMGQLEKHPRGGAAEDGRVDDAAESYKIARYSKKFVIDEMDIIDDSFGVLESVPPEELGAEAMELKPDLVYAILLSNPNMRDGNALFDASHNNTDTLVFNKSNLQTRISAMMNQQRDGRQLNIRPRYLLVNPDLEWDARELLTSGQLLIAGNTDTVRGNRNVLADLQLQLRVEGRLKNGVTDPDSGTTFSGSGTTWFQAAGTRWPTIEVGFLRGTGRAPQLTTWNKRGEDGVWGVGFSVKMDIGAKALDWPGLDRGNT